MSDNAIEALRPFANYARQMDKAWTQLDDSVYYGVKRPGMCQVTRGDFRRALQVVDEADAAKGAQP